MVFSIISKGITLRKVEFAGAKHALTVSDSDSEWCVLAGSTPSKSALDNKYRPTVV